LSENAFVNLVRRRICILIVRFGPSTIDELREVHPISERIGNRGDIGPISIPSGGRDYSVRDPKELPSTTELISRAIRLEYILAYVAASPMRQVPRNRCQDRFFARPALQDLEPRRVLFPHRVTAYFGHNQCVPKSRTCFADPLIDSTGQTRPALMRDAASTDTVCLVPIATVLDVDREVQHRPGLAIGARRSFEPGRGRGPI
jgi:hypothetical protein